jgi:hypothetical protein
VGKRRSTLHDGFLKEATRSRHRQHQPDAEGPRRPSKHGHVSRVTAERGNLLFDPGECRQLVEQPFVPCRREGLAADLDAAQVAEEPEAIVDGDDHHIAASDEGRTVDDWPYLGITPPPAGETWRGHAADDAARLTIGRILDDGYVDCFRHKHARRGGFTYPTEASWLRLDYIFASPALARYLDSWHIIDTRLARRASDHLPVMASFLQGPRPDP